MSDEVSVEEKLRLLADFWDECSNTALWLNSGANKIERLEARVKELEGGWISVNDALPDCRCMAFTPDNEDESMRHRIIPAGMFKQIAKDASHWMPLPEAPND
jgi:hypothetical protein